MNIFKPDNLLCRINSDFILVRFTKKSQKMRSITMVRQTLMFISMSYKYLKVFLLEVQWHGHFFLLSKENQRTERKFNIILIIWNMTNWKQHIFNSQRKFKFIFLCWDCVTSTDEIVSFSHLSPLIWTCNELL